MNNPWVVLGTDELNDTVMETSRVEELGDGTTRGVLEGVEYAVSLIYWEVAGSCIFIVVSRCHD